jgi:hypothetical protein
VDDLEKDNVQSDVSSSHNKNVSSDDGNVSSSNRLSVCDGSAVMTFLDKVETDNRLGQLDKVLNRIGVQICIALSSLWLEYTRYVRGTSQD